MDIQRKKELLEDYKHRRPEMGVIALRCRETGESFLGASADIKADFNSVCVKLESGMHPNRQMQELWRAHGAQGFEQIVLETLDYDDPKENHAPALEKMRAAWLQKDPRAQKIWR